MASKVNVDDNTPWPIIGVVGCGTIAAAVTEGLCKIKNNPPNKIILCPRNAAKTGKLAENFPNICISHQNKILRRVKFCPPNFSVYFP